MTKEEIKQKILDYVKSHEYVTFAEIKRLIGDADFSGNVSISLLSYDNIILWVNISQKVADALGELRLERSIYHHPASLLLYVCDGLMLRMPLANKLCHYKEPHWCPICYCTFPIVMNSKSKRSKKGVNQIKAKTPAKNRCSDNDVI